MPESADAAAERAARSAARASRSDPSPLQRSVTSWGMRALGSPRLRDLRRSAVEWSRGMRGAPHRVEYFHQVDDPYSQLVAQRLARLRDSYGVEIVPHLVAPPTRQNAPEPERLDAFARRDAADVAGGYGLSFPAHAEAPGPEAVLSATQRLSAAIDDGSFVERVAAIGAALWAGEGELHDARAASAADAERCVARGSARREALGHYLGATLHYAGEWYWGIDRIVHLEARLRSLGLGTAAEPVAPRPSIDAGSARGDERIALEIFPSLRSPYTAIAFAKAVELARTTGVKLVVRPVLPMVMRGVPLTFTKGRYIAMDARREADLLGVPFGRIRDPIGRPVERAYSLLAWAREQGRDAEFIAAFLRGAWAEGVDTSHDQGLRRVVEMAGLAWSEARSAVGNDDWRSELEGNRLVMLDELGLWGVPSFRIRGPEGFADYSTWGQDRLWRVADELRTRSAALA